jgi:hypothetical protein
MTEDQRETRRKKRVLEYAEKHGNIRTTCRRFGIARSTFYRWRDRYRECGEAGLARRRPRTHNYPNKTPDEVVEKILHLRRTYHMGPIRIVWQSIGSSGCVFGQWPSLVVMASPFGGPAAGLSEQFRTRRWNCQSAA